MDSKYVYIVIREWCTEAESGWDIVEVCHSLQTARAVLASKSLDIFKAWNKLYLSMGKTYSVVTRVKSCLELKYEESYEKVRITTREVK